MSRKRKSRDQDGLYRRKDSPYWWASYIDASGARTRRSTETAERREAEALLAKWKLEEYRSRQWDEEPSRTFDELMLDYLNEHSDKRSAASDRHRTRTLQKTFGGRDMSGLGPADIRAYVVARRGQGVKPATVNRELALLSAAINYANREWDWQLPNPTVGRKLKEPEGRVRWISPEEADALIQAAREVTRSPYLADFIQVAVNTGCRSGELLGLEWRRVDFQAGLIHLEEDHTKAAKRRSVPLNEGAQEGLLNRMRYRASHCPAAPWVFCRPNGARLGSVKKGFAKACRMAGIEDFHVHDMRHTCAAWLVSSGVRMPEVRDLLGHSTIEMTERYAHLAPENVRAAVAPLDEFVSRSRHVANESPKKRGSGSS